MVQVIKDKAAQNRILLATILASGMAFMFASALTIALPSIQNYFHADFNQLLWVSNGYTLPLAALIFVSGSLSDIFGTKRIFVTGIVIFMISSLLAAIAPSIGVLIAAMFLIGFGGALTIPGSLAIINYAFDKSVRGKAIGLWSGIAGGIDTLGGTIVSGFLIQNISWQAFFVLIIPVGLLALYYTIKYVPESDKRSVKIDWAGVVLIAVSLTSIAYGIINGSTSGWTNTSEKIALVFGAAMLLLFVFVETRVKDPIVDFKLFRSRPLLGANLMTLLIYFALYGAITFITINLQQLQGIPPLNAGLASLPAIIIITFISGPAGALADRIGSRTQMILGPLVVAFGMLLSSFIGENAVYIVNVFPGIVLIGIGMGLLVAPLTKTALDVEQKYSGMASGINNGISRIASLLAIALMGAIIISAFTSQLNLRIRQTNLLSIQQEKIFEQSQKLLSIEIPESFTLAEKLAVKQVVNASFVDGYHSSMLFASACVFLSVLVGFLTIKNDKRSPKKD
jgi:EmrB/QacA subfamily drug resistance transporter